MTKATLLWKNSLGCVIDAASIDTHDTSDELTAAVVQMITGGCLEIGDQLVLTHDTAEAHWLHQRQLGGAR